MNEYATAVELKKSLELTGETFADDDIARGLTAASRGIDKALGRRFWLDADANQIRHYTPDSRTVIDIDDLVTLTSIATDRDGTGVFGTAWTAADFLLEPLNAQADGEPWTQVRLHPRSSQRWPGYPRSVRVTGKFGWPTVPPGVKEATLMIAARLVRRVREAPFGVVAVGMDGAAMHIARTDPDVKMLLHGLSRRVPLVA